MVRHPCLRCHHHPPSPPRQYIRSVTQAHALQGGRRVEGRVAHIPGAMHQRLVQVQHQRGEVGQVGREGGQEVLPRGVREFLTAFSWSRRATADQGQRTEKKPFTDSLASSRNPEGNRREGSRAVASREPCLRCGWPLQTALPKGRCGQTWRSASCSGIEGSRVSPPAPPAQNSALALRPDVPALNRAESCGATATVVKCHWSRDQMVESVATWSPPSAGANCHDRE